MSKLIKSIVCLAMLVGLIPQTMEVKATGGNVTITKTEDKVSIGNQYIKRNYQTANNKWKTESIENKRINETFTPSNGSDDFVIHFVNEKDKEKPTIVAPTQKLERKDWTATLKNSSGTVFTTTNILFDGDKNTSIDEYTITGHPFSLEINLGSKQQVSSFSYLKRPGFEEEAFGLNGSIGKFKLYVSEDGSKWTPAGKGEFTRHDYNLHNEGNLFNVGDPVYANFDKTYETQYVKIEVLDDVLGNRNEFTGAEVNLFSDAVSLGMPQKQIDLTDKAITFNGSDASKLADGNTLFTVAGNINDEIIIDLKTSMNVGSFAYHKRPGYHEEAYGVNGTMGKYELYVSDDGNEWLPAGKGEFNREDHKLHTVVLGAPLKTNDGNYQAGDTLYNVGDYAYGNFDQIHTTRFVKIVPKSDCLGGTNEFAVTEIKLFEDQKYESKKSEQEIHSSELEIEQVTTNTNEVRVNFKPFEKKGVNWSIDMVTVMENNKHYMNTYLEITADQPDLARIDYIDFDHFVINNETTKDVWSIPDEQNISSMWIGKHELMLGQPIYADGLFFGSEFPAQETDVVDDAMQIRYYSGKSIARMAQDHQNVINGNTFRTWNNVVGAAQGTPSDVVQTDFFAYIEDIATPSTFRKQYNSWYDNMMGISESSIEKSFLGSEKGLAQNGIEPLDSYVVDDGWNNYNDGVHVHPYESGTTPNETGFWEFNNKFPNELYVSSHLVNKLNSSFGVWVGPRGGYNFPGELAHIFENKGTGYVHGRDGDVCTGSRKYIQNFEKRFVDYQTRFDIDYWKWDGFSWHPCNNPEHDHMTGGHKDMYYTSDMWEAWTDLFEHAREARRKQGKGLWINATCYINLSPWLLQWVNTIWVQDSGDTGQAGDQAAARHQQKIYYRDQVYYQLYKQNQVQFPLKNIYNHDPIYGVSDGSNATTDVFREFLFDNAMRGTAFWELYYSPSIFDDAKWKVTVDALDFAENNHDVLKNAKLFVEAGKKPVNGVYGYSAWNANEGIVSFVNPTNSEQTYELVLNNVVGVPTTMSGLKETQIYPYASETASKVVSYGDTLQVTLAPFSSQIYKYSNEDVLAPQLVSAKILSDSTVKVRFDERVNADMTFMINNESCQATLLDDYRTFKLTAQNLGKTASLEVSNIMDIYGNKASDVKTDIESGQNLVEIHTKQDLDPKATSTNDIFRMDAETYTVSDKGIKGTNDFSISFLVDTLSANTTILRQGNDYELKIDQDGYVEFKVHDLTVSSKEEIVTVKEKAHGIFNTDEYVETTTNTTIVGKVNDGKKHTINAVREPNGVLKLYVDGRLSASTYKKGVVANLTSEAIQLGSKDFHGLLSNVTVKNSAVYYDDAMKFANSFGVGEAYIKLEKDGWSAQACSEANSGSDGGAKETIDDNDQTYWHSNYSGQDTCNGKHHLTINFNKPTTFDALRYTARPIGSNGNWKTVDVIGIDETGKETNIKVNEAITLKDNAYVFMFDQPQTFSKIRFEIEGEGGFASAAEIDALLNNVNETRDLLVLQKEAYDILANADKTNEGYAQLASKVEEIYNLSITSTKETIEAKRQELYALRDQATSQGCIKPMYMSATLNDKVSMNVYLSIDQSVLNDENAYVEYKVNDTTKRIAVKDLQANEDGLYKVDMPLYARQMSDVVTFLTHTAKEEKTYQYSIVEYANSLLADSPTKEVKECVEAMLNYGANAQTYFKYNVENLANKGITNKEYETVTQEAFAPYAMQVSGEVAGMNYGASNLRLLSDVALRHHFKVTPAIQQAYQNGAMKIVLVLNDTEKELTPTFYGQDKMFVEVENINVENYDQTYRVEVRDLTNNTTLRVDASVFSYGNEMLKKQDAKAETLDIVKAMYVYNKKAKAYQATMK